MITTASPTMFCPSWCQNHEAGVGRNDRPLYDHIGPEFGPFLTVQTTYLDNGERVPVEIRACDVDDVLQTPISLRELAAAALEAAEWLESQR